ncbi:co-chaperone GroES [Rickettsiales bacterium LUAb2]
MKFTPLSNNILIKRLEQVNTTKGGIIIPDSAKEKPIEGEVVAVGKGLKTEDGKVVHLDVKVGDIVVFAKWGGTELNIEGVDYLIMKETDILGIKG